MHPGTATITARRRTAREAKKDMAEARILIAEDNELVARTLEEQLTTLGYEVAGVARTAEAVRL